VNGVINIITKSAAATQGGQFVIGGGNVEGTYGRVRWGGQNADGSVLYRVYGSKQNANSQNAIYGGDGMDAYHTEAAGFRVDGYLSGGARWDVSGDFYSARSDLVTTFSLPNTVFANPGTESHDGQTLRGRYIQSLSHGGDLQIQVAYAHANLTMGELLADRRETFDIDVHHLFKLGERHDIVWGGGYRLSRDNMPVTLMVWENETSRRTGSYGIFGQDEITLAENWRLTLGLRMDHNEFTGWEKQPDARLSWHLSPAHTLWGALSKTSRAPSRGEQGINFSYMEGTTTLGPGPTVPNVLRVLNQGQYSEKLKATQVGLRSQWAPALTTDAVLFSHRYDRVGAFDPGAVRFVPHQVGTYIDYVDIYLPYVNLGELTLNGAELSMDWHPAQSWYLRMSQTWQSVVSSSELMWVEGSGIVPHQTTSLHASWAPTSATNVSLWLRHMDERPGSIGILVDARRAYNSVDLSATWKLQKYLEISLVGQNLNDGACDAYADIPDAKTFPMLLPTCTPRSLSAQLRMNF
jgi:iron complex outermembrane receptor protein